MASPGQSSTQTLLQYYDGIQAASELVRSRLGTAHVAIVLGSGLSSFASNLRSTKTLSYKEIPQMPQTAVPGHAGELISGELASKSGGLLKILCFSGRVHWYEGFSFEQVNFMVRLAAACGCSSYILTNSAGGAMPHMKPGSAMIVTDHIRFARVDPLREVLAAHRRLQPDSGTSRPYSDRLIRLAKQAAEALGETVYEGVYCWCGGPSYETPAEVQAAMRMGAGAFGMSTVPEVLAGAAIGLEIFAISLCTNMASGLQAHETLLHADVIRVAKESGPRFENLLLQFFYNFEPCQGPVDAPAQLDAEQRAILGQSRLLPIQPYWSGTDAVDADCARLKDAFNKDSHHVAVFLDPSLGVRPLGDRLHALPSVAFADLAAFVAVSPNAARKGRIVCASGDARLGDWHNASILVVEQDARFAPILDFESHHLIGVLARLGVRKVVQLVASRSESLAEGCFSVSGVVDLTSDKPYPGFLSSLTRLHSAKGMDGFPSAQLSVFPGPSLASPAEFKLTLGFGTPAYTCTSLSPAYSALHARLHCSVVACIPSATLDVLDTLATALKSCSLHAPPAKPSPWLQQLPSLPYRRFIAEDVEHVRMAAAEIKGALMSGGDRVHFAVVVDSALTSVMSDMKWRSSVSVENVQGWRQDLSQYWRLSVGTWPRGRSLLCLHSSQPPSDQLRFPLFDATFAIRVFQALGIGTVVFVGAGIAADHSILVGSIVGVSDHINLSGENPLFGANQDEFGVRFPDMSRVYTPVPSLPKHVIVGYLPHTPAHSYKLAEQLGFQAYCCNLVPEVVVARHSALSVSSVLWIAGSCVSSEEAQVDESVCREVQLALSPIFTPDQS